MRIATVPELDDVDRTILELLVTDARRPYSEIAEHVDLSPPAVRDRIDRLVELGVIRSFTVDLDRSKLHAGTPVLVELSLVPGAVQTAEAALAGRESIEHRFTTADSRIVLVATLQGGVEELLEETVPVESIRSIDVTPLSDAAWTPGVGEATLAIDCVECGNTVTSEGESATIDGTRYHFCCGSCLDRFESRYDRLSEGA